MITDNCPNCKKEYFWDSCQDTYVGTIEEEVYSGLEDETRQVTIYYCTGCGYAIAMFLTDDNGGHIFVPSTKEL